MARLFATKPLALLMDEAHEEGEQTLKRSLGPINLITLLIGKRGPKSDTAASIF